VEVFVLSETEIAAVAAEFPPLLKGSFAAHIFTVRDAIEERNNVDSTSNQIGVDLAGEFSSVRINADTDC
jgi:hypothetical protein